MENKTALIVDQSITMRKTIHSYLHTNFNCIDCDSREKAIKLLRSRMVDLVVTELRFSNKVDTDYLAQIKQINRNAKLVVVTREVSQSLVFSTVRIGIDAIVTKPLHSSVLFSKIQELFSAEVFPVKAVVKMVEELKFKIERRADFTVVSVIGKLVSRNTAKLKVRLEGLISKGIRKIALDLSRVTCIDSSAVGLLLNAFKKLKRMAGTFCIYNIANLFNTFITHIRLENMIPVYFNEAEFLTAEINKSDTRMAYPSRII